MKRAALIGTLVVSLVAGSAAMAHPGDRGHDSHRERARSHQVERRDFDSRRGYRVREEHRERARYGVYYRPHGYYAHRWARGERLPSAYYARPYVVADYDDWGLRAPPRGYRWVRVDGDAVLAAVATGLVLDTMFHVFN
jgi:Ni/Co efflux regulator RcnB